MPPALVGSCPTCGRSTRVLRQDSRWFVCSACRQVLRIVEGALLADGELPLPPLRPRPHEVAESIWINEDVFVVVAVKEYVDNDRNELTEYALLAPAHGPAHYLIESAGNPEWSHHVPLNASMVPILEEQTLMLPGAKFEKSLRVILTPITACGEFALPPLSTERCQRTFYRGVDGIIVHAVDPARLEDVNASRCFRVVSRPAREVAQPGVPAAGANRPAITGDSTESRWDWLVKDGRLGTPWQVLIGIAIVLTIVYCSSDDDDEPSCESRAASSGWTHQQLEECKNAESGRGSSGFGGGK